MLSGLLWLLLPGLSDCLSVLLLFHQGELTIAVQPQGRGGRIGRIGDLMLVWLKIGGGDLLVLIQMLGMRVPNSGVALMLACYVIEWTCLVIGGPEMSGRCQVGLLLVIDDVNLVRGRQ